MDQFGHAASQQTEMNKALDSLDVAIDKAISDNKAHLARIAELEEMLQDLLGKYTFQRDDSECAHAVLNKGK